MPSLRLQANLEVHHQEYRSQGGDDSEKNLVTLCVACHTLAHGEIRPL